MSDLSKTIEDVRGPWIGSRYYRDAEKWTHVFWDKERPFRRLFDKLTPGTVIELACGHGRHGERAALLVRNLTMVDVIEGNLAVCRERLAGFANVTIKLGDGARFPDAAPDSVDAIYCYDAMVHFSPDIVTSYLQDSARVLRSGGRALYHHSNYAEGEGKRWSQNPHARNYMTRELFAEIAQGAGLRVIEQVVIPWGNVADLDCISLLEEP